MIDHYVYGPISEYAYDASADGVRRALAAAGKGAVRMRVHSPGGGLFEAQAMAALLEAHPGDVEIVVDGLAASAATMLLTVRGARVVASDRAEIMIHESRAAVAGQATDVEAAAAMMRAANRIMASALERRTGKPREEIDAALAAETWLTADEAVEFGLVDALVEASPEIEAKLAQPFNLSAEHAPERVRLAAQTGNWTRNANLCQGDSMDPEIRKRLGLSETATDAEVLAALDAVCARPAAPPEAPPAPATAPAAIAPEDLQAMVSTAVAAALAPAAPAADAHQMAAIAVVERFTAERKIRPADRDLAIAACGTTAAQLNAAVAYWTSAPQIVAEVQLPEADKGSALTPEEKAMIASAGLTADEYLAQKREQENAE